MQLPESVAEMRERLKDIYRALGVERVLQRQQLCAWMLDAAIEAGISDSDFYAVCRNACKRWPGLDKLIAEYRKDPPSPEGLA